MSKTFPTIASSIGIHRLSKTNKMNTTKQSTTLTIANRTIVSESEFLILYSADIKLNGRVFECRFTVNKDGSFGSLHDTRNKSTRTISAVNSVRRSIREFLQNEYPATTIESIISIRTDDATPDWTSRKNFVVGQTTISPSPYSRFIGHDKNLSACFYFANVDADGDPVNIQDAICDLANHLNIDQKLFNEMLSRVSMNLATVDAVESSIYRHYKTESLKIIHAMQNGERGSKFGNLYFTFLNSTK